MRVVQLWYAFNGRSHCPWLNRNGPQMRRSFLNRRSDLNTLNVALRLIATCAFAVLGFVDGLDCKLLADDAVLADSAPKKSDSRDKSSKVDALLKPWDTLAQPGCAIGVVRAGKVIYAKGFGASNLDYDAAIDPQTTFQIASFSKAFTSLCVAMLMDEGKIKPDDDIRKFLPEMHEFKTPITVRNLLRCHSGTRDFLHLMQLAGWPLEPSWVSYSEDDVFEVLTYQKTLQVEPGKKFSYCNSDYFLLAQIIQQASGMHISEFAKRRIFDPLGMTRTEYAKSPSFVSKNRAIGYEPRPIPKHSLTKIPLIGWATSGRVMGGCGIRTCVIDLARWDRNFYDNKLKGGKNVETFFKTGGVLGNQFCLSVDAYHKTWNKKQPELVGQYNGRKFMEFTGGGWGFASCMARYPEQRLTVICLTNNAESITPWSMTKKIAEIYLDESKPSPQRQTDEKKYEFVSLPIDQLKERVGRFQDAVGRIWSTTLIGDKLHYTNSRGETHVLAATKDGKFIATESPYEGDYFKFERPKSDAPFDLILGWETGTVKFKRIIRLQPSEQELNEFCGKYTSEELPVIYQFSVRNKELGLKIGVGRWEKLQMGKQDRFVPVICHQYDLRLIEFERSKAGKVTGFIIGSGRAQRLPFRKLIR
jgi:CubicO group peptidase (beta-lactamase class C family)